MVLKGEKFDKAYVTAMVKGHIAVLDTLDAWLRGSEPRMSAVLSKRLGRMWTAV